jgi:DNA topoisomerase I
MKLMIIESPGKIAKLSAILGPDWKIAASVGHVRDLPLKEMGVEAPEFRPQYELTERGSGVVAKLKNLVRDADSVYLATDPDREGESISWHLQQCLKLKNPLRVTFNEITPSAVKAALVSPRTIDVKRVAAQEARRVLDRLVGYMVSPELSNQTGQRLSAGRVQSPAVRLVVERERQIRAFKQTLHFGARLFFAGAKTEWFADWITKHDGPDWLPKGLDDFVTDESPYFMDREFAAAVARVKTVHVAAYEQGQEKRSPPPPFTTSTMQQAASVSIGLDPKAAMEAAQKLYEQGHITYHRTDNPNVSDESLGDIYAVAVKLGLEMADEPRKFKAPAGAQVGHPAVTPTHWEIEEAGETPEQRSLYKLIRLRAIACQLADAKYAVRMVTLQATEPVDGKTVAFKAKGRTLIYSGWLKLIEGDQTEDESLADKEPANPVPELGAGQVLSVERGELLEKKTRPPTRYTQATLVRKLEAEGIGRPATYAAIMDNIMTRSYVRTDKKFLVPTDTGELICDSLVGRFEFMDLGFTRDVEHDLDRIAEGEAVFKGVIERVYEKLQRELSTLQVSGGTPKHPCPECGKSLRRIKGKTGFFWGCSGHPDCSATLPDKDGKPGQKEPQAVSEFACAKCGRPLAHRVKKGKGGYDFYGCTGYRDGCKESYPTKDGKPDFSKAK